MLNQHQKDTKKFELENYEITNFKLYMYQNLLRLEVNNFNLLIVKRGNLMLNIISF